ncbi:hypothetical protein JCM24511_06404 [Saitozyma sp. JCM 24511]|nr:hypothetical protein JCM24511_06404 [Saitozyma sp. JCM 24511]
MSSNATSSDPAEVAAAAAFSGDKGLYLGPFIMGLFIDAILCGIMIMQFAHWASFARKERTMNKVIVIVSFIVSLIVSTYMVAYNMHLFGKSPLHHDSKILYGFGTYANFAATDWLGYFLLGDAIVAVLVQFFFAERAYRFTNNNKIFLVVLGLMMLLGFAGCIGTLVGFRLLTSTDQVGQLHALVYCWLGGQLATDLTLSATIMWGLIQSRTGWSATDKLVKRLVTISMETQLPPTVIAVIFVINYSVQPTSLVDATFDLIMSKFYVCGLLGALNSRYALRRELDSEGTHNNTFNNAKSNRPTQATVHIATETYVESHPISTLPVGINRVRTRYPPGGGREADSDEDHDKAERESGFEISDADGSSARKLDYVDNESRTVLTA